MRPRRLRARGFSSFASLDLDLAALLPDVGIVALVGQTGAGKTTLMDAFGGPAVWWRDLPTHGALREFCVGRDAEVELVYDYAGETYRSLIQVDTEARGGAGKDEAHLFRRDASGGWEPLTPLGRTNDYRDEVLARMPAQDLYMAAAYAAQDRGGSFFALTVPERRKLFERLLGLGALQRRADRAGAAVAVLDALLAEVARDAARVRLDADQAAGLTADLAAVSAAAGPLDAAEQAAERAVAEADRVLAEASAALAPLLREREAAVTRAAELQAATSRAVREASEARETVADLRARVAGAAGIRKRADELVAANAALAVARDAYVAARAHADTRRAEHVAADRVADEASATHLRARTDRERAERAAVDLDATLARVGDVAALRAAAADLSRRVADAEAALLPRLRSNRAESAAADLRLRDARADLSTAEKAASLLDGVPCRGERVIFVDAPAGPWTKGEPLPVPPAADCGACQFLTSAQRAAATVPGLRAALPTLEADAAAARRALDADLAAESDLVALRAERDRAVASVAERAADEASIATLRERASGLDAARATEEAEAARVAELRRVAIDARAVTEAAELAQAEAKRVGQDAAALVASLAGADVALRDLEAAEVALPLAEASLAQATRRMEELDEALSAHVVPPDPDARDADAARITARDARQSLTEARQASRSTESRAAALRGRLAQLGDVVARAADLEARRAALAQKRAGFALVERAFGDRGIQALEIDAAGPEVSGLVNDLLASCFGPRFTTRLRTVQDAGAGKVQKEVFDLEIFDGARGGRPCAYRHLSGGQQVMISAALRLALVIANARRHGTQLESLFLDEADTGLDEGLRAAYPSMLRRARELGGFRHVFFISHSRAAWSQADAVIRVEGGTAWIE